MAAKCITIYPKRGEIYLVSFDPTLGAEIQKTRPALVLQNYIANEYSPITIVTAITSQFPNKINNISPKTPKLAKSTSFSPVTRYSSASIS